MRQSRDDEMFPSVMNDAAEIHHHLSSNDVLIIHSAFRGLSRAGYRAETFIDGLLTTLYNGTLLMPAMTWRQVTPEFPNFDELQTTSETGALSEVFRTQYATDRSIHPTHSATAYGTAAHALTRDHHLGVTPCPPNSPFGRLADADALILLLGVGFECCTAIHCYEELVAPDLYMLPLEDAVTYSCTDRIGITHRVCARRHRRLDRDFTKFEARLAEKGKLIRGELLGTNWLLCRAADLRDDVMLVLAERSDGTLLTS